MYLHTLYTADDDDNNDNNNNDHNKMKNFIQSSVQLDVDIKACLY